MESSMARRLWHVVCAVLYVLRKGMSKRKLAMDFHLLLRRGKISGKALGNLMTSHGHHHHDHHFASASAPASADAPPSFSCRALDPALAVYDPRGTREVEFSCSNTPSYPSLHLVPSKRRRRNSHRRHHRGANGAEPGWYNYDASDIARVFEILNNEQLLEDDAAPELKSAIAATPSPALWSSFGRSPAPVRQLRITDSPFPVRDDAGEDGGHVDRQAEEFIKKFYEQLRVQQITAATPDNGYGTYGYTRPVTGMA